MPFCTSSPCSCYTLDTVEGATQSLPLAIYWLLQVEVKRLGGPYQLSHELYDTFLRFTSEQGWERVIKAWMPGVIYPTVVTVIGEFTEEGIILLFALILEHSIDKVGGFVFCSVSHPVEPCTRILISR